MVPSQQLTANIPADEPEFAAFVGVDWGDQKSSWCLQTAGSEKVERGEITNQPAAVKQWVADLLQRFGDRRVAVAIEQSRGHVVYQLLQYPNLVIFAVHPNMSAQFSRMLHPSGAKGDPADARDLLQLLLRHRGYLHRLDPETPQTRLLQMLVEQRRTLVDDKTAYSNRLTAALKLYFPQLLAWVSDIDSPLGCDWIEKWPTLQAIQHCHPGTLRKFFSKHNCRSARRIDERIEEIYAALPAVQDCAIIEGASYDARHCASIIKTLHQAIAELDHKIAELVADHPEAALFKDVPGVGPALLPRLVVAFGTQRNRYRDAAQLQAYSGVAPVTRQSGKQRQVSWRFACPKFLRQTFVEFAAMSIRSCAWARAYYDLQRSKQKKHHAIIRALAYKWTRILFRCWKDRKPYNEEQYLASLAKRNSPFAVAPGPSPTQLGWRDVCGFSKLDEKNA